MRGLFKTIPQCEQFRLAESGAEERYGHRQVVGGEARRHDQVGETRQIGDTGRSRDGGPARGARGGRDLGGAARTGRIDEGVELVLGHHVFDQIAGHRQEVVDHRLIAWIGHRRGRQVAVTQQAPARRVGPGPVLAHADVFLVAVHQFGESLGVPRLQGFQVIVDLHLEFGGHDDRDHTFRARQEPFRIADIDHGGARLPHGHDRGFDHPVHIRVGAHEVAGEPDARALEAVGFQELGVVLLELAFALLGGVIPGIDTGHGAERERDVGHIAGQRPAGVERQPQRNNAGAGQQPVGRLQADHAIDVGGPADRAAGVGSEA